MHPICRQTVLSPFACILLFHRLSRSHSLSSYLYTNFSQAIHLYPACPKTIFMPFHGVLLIPRCSEAISCILLVPRLFWTHFTATYLSSDCLKSFPFNIFVPKLFSISFSNVSNTLFRMSPVRPRSYYFYRQLSSMFICCMKALQLIDQTVSACKPSLLSPFHVISLPQSPVSSWTRHRTAHIELFAFPWIFFWNQHK